MSCRLCCWLARSVTLLHRRRPSGDAAPDNTADADQRGLRANLLPGAARTSTTCTDWGAPLPPKPQCHRATLVYNCGPASCSGTQYCRRMRLVVGPGRLCALGEAVRGLQASALAKPAAAGDPAGGRARSIAALFWKLRRERGAPHPAWYLAVPLVQVLDHDNAAHPPPPPPSLSIKHACQAPLGGGGGGGLPLLDRFTISEPHDQHRSLPGALSACSA